MNSGEGEHNDDDQAAATQAGMEVVVAGSNSEDQEDKIVQADSNGEESWDQTDDRKSGAEATKRQGAEDKDLKQLYGGTQIQNIQSGDLESCTRVQGVQRRGGEASGDIVYDFDGEEDSSKNHRRVFFVEDDDDEGQGDAASIQGEDCEILTDDEEEGDEGEEIPRHHEPTSVLPAEESSDESSRSAGDGPFDEMSSDESDSDYHAEIQEGYDEFDHTSIGGLQGDFPTPASPGTIPLKRVQSAPVGTSPATRSDPKYASAGSNAVSPKSSNKMSPRARQARLSRFRPKISAPLSPVRNTMKRALTRFKSGDMPPGKREQKWWQQLHEAAKKNRGQKANSSGEFDLKLKHRNSSDDGYEHDDLYEEEKLNAGRDYSDTAYDRSENSFSDAISDGLSRLSLDADEFMDRTGLVTANRQSKPKGVDLSSLPYIAPRFVHPADNSIKPRTSGGATFSSPYLDDDVDDSNASAIDSARLVWEHHLLVKALLQNLAERDFIGVEDSVHDESNVIKKGSLKKKSAKLWSVKYIEVRMGNLTYYEDSPSNSNRRRSGYKIIHLRKDSCICRPVGKPSDSDTFLFEIVADGGPRRLWMSKSEGERQGWIRAIHQAMIGDDANFDSSVRGLDTRKNVASATSPSQEPFDASLYQPDLAAYDAIRASLQSGDIESYRTLADHASLRLPLQWVREQADPSSSAIARETTARQRRHRLRPTKGSKRVRTSVSGFWNSLDSTSSVPSPASSVFINDQYVPCGSSFFVERVVGALTRCLLDFERGDDAGSTSRKNSKDEESRFMSELDAVSYARRILVSLLQSRDRNDAHHSLVSLLCQNDQDVSVDAASSTPGPIHIEVSYAFPNSQAGFLVQSEHDSDLTGWLQVKTKKSRWKRRFAILSEAMLSLYEYNDTRPHGLREQIPLNNATVLRSENNVVHVLTKQHERQFQFEGDADSTELFRWHDAFQNAAGIAVKPNAPATYPPVLKSASSDDGTASAAVSPRRGQAQAYDAGPSQELIELPSSYDTDPSSLRKPGRISAGVKRLKGAKGNGIKAIKEATSKIKDKLARGIRRLPSSSDGPTDSRRPHLEMLKSSTRDQYSATGDDDQAPLIQIVADFTTSHKVAPSDRILEDSIIEARVKIEQAYLLCGGRSSRLARGDELVVIDFKPPESRLEASSALETPTLL